MFYHPKVNRGGHFSNIVRLSHSLALKKLILLSTAYNYASFAEFDRQHKCKSRVKLMKHLSILLALHKLPSAFLKIKHPLGWTFGLV